MTQLKVCLLVLAAAAAALWFWFEPSSPAPVATTHEPVNAAALPSPGWLANDIPSPFATPALAPLPLAAQIDQHLSTGGPEGAFLAFKLIQRCVDFEKYGGKRASVNHAVDITYLFKPEAVGYAPVHHMDEMPQKEKDQLSVLCRGLTERMRAARSGYLTTATKAGVRGADVSFFELGPFGDRSALLTRPDDQLVAEWKRQAQDLLTRRASEGDPHSLSTIIFQALQKDPVFSQDVVRVQAYVSAFNAISKEAGAPISLNVKPDVPLTSEQLATVDAMTAEILAKVKGNRIRCGTITCR